MKYINVMESGQVVPTENCRIAQAEEVIKAKDDDFTKDGKVRKAVADRIITQRNKLVS